MQLNSADRYTGRNVTIISVIVGLIGAAAPVVANMDLSSSAGIVAALVALSAVVVKYLDGSQRYEARLDGVTPTDAPAPGPAAAVEPPKVNGRGTRELVEDAWAVPTDPEPSTSALGSEPDDELGDALGVEEVADVPDPPRDDELEEVLVGAGTGAEGEPDVD